MSFVLCSIPFYNLMLCSIIQCNTTLHYDIVLYGTVLYHIVSLCHIVLHYKTRYILAHYIISYRIARCYIVLFDIISGYVRLKRTDILLLCSIISHII